MRLFRKIIIPIVVILLYLPITTDAGFLVKKNDLSTVQTVSAKESSNKIFTNASTSEYKGYIENTVAHKKTFFGKIVQKFSDIRTSFSAGKKKWVAILLGFLDIFVLGYIGLPRFYMGYTAAGLMQLIFTLLGAVGIVCLILAFGLGQLALLIPAYLCIGLCIFSAIWQIVDLIRILCNSLKPKEGYWED